MLKGLIYDASPDAVYRDWLSMAAQHSQHLDATEFMESMAAIMVAGRGPDGEFPMTESQLRQHALGFHGWMYSLYRDQLTSKLEGDHGEFRRRVDASNFPYWCDVATRLSSFMVCVSSMIKEFKSSKTRGFCVIDNQQSKIRTGFPR